MPEENVEVVRGMYEAFSRGDADASLSCLDPDVVLDATHRVDGRIGRGRDEAARMLGEWLSTWEDWTEEVEEIRDLGDNRVLVLSTQRGRGRGSGLDFENKFGMLYELDQGKIVRWTVYDDRSKALKAAGLAE